MKAIILAAGMGTRMDKYAKNLPKCMLSLNGKTLIERQIDTLRSCDVNDIIVVKGYMPDKINISGVKYYVNEDYENTNMVETLMCAEEEMNDDILVCYGDILYEKRIIKIVLENKSDIGVVVDENYWDYWKARLDNPEEDQALNEILSDSQRRLIARFPDNPPIHAMQTGKHLTQPHFHYQMFPSDAHFRLMYAASHDENGLAVQIDRCKTHPAYDMERLEQIASSLKEL